jgi:hypothetical protein
MPLVIWAHQGRLDREPYCRLMVQKNSVLVSSKSAVFIISKSHRAWVSALSPKVRKYCSVVSNAGCVYNPRPLAEFVPKAYTSTGISGFLKAVRNSVAPLMPSSFNDAGEMSPVDAVLSLSQVLLAHMKSQHMRSALTCVGKGPSRLLASFGRLVLASAHYVPNIFLRLCITNISATICAYNITSPLPRGWCGRFRVLATGLFDLPMFLPSNLGTSFSSRCTIVFNPPPPKQLHEVLHFAAVPS